MRPENFLATILQKVINNSLVTQSGFEPETVCLEGRCSIQLSYWAS